MEWTLGEDARKAIGPILKLIRQHTDFLISAHVNVDGDAVGSELALYHILRELGKRPHIVNSEDCPDDLAFLPGAQVVESGPEKLKKAYDAAIILDAGDLDRCEAIHEHIPRPLALINIDHHASNTQFGDYNWVDPTAAAVGEMIYILMKELEVDLTPEIAENLYVAILTDTGRFQFSNTTEFTLRMASELVASGIRTSELYARIYRDRPLGEVKMLGSVIRDLQTTCDGRIAWSWIDRSSMDETGFIPEETQPFVDILKSIHDVELAILFRERPEDGVIKVSLRSEESVDSSVLAAEFGGGGHPRASGLTSGLGREELEQKLIARACEMLSAKA
jgi:phosphoesterase RecJ-like protein